MNLQVRTSLFVQQEIVSELLVRRRICIHNGHSKQTVQRVDGDSTVTLGRCILDW